MSKTTTENKDHVALCPVGRFFADLEKVSGKGAPFFEHLRASRVEFLKGIRSLVDDRIRQIEDKSAENRGKKATRVKVE